MSNEEAPAVTPEEEVHPSEQGPFEAGKEVGLGDQPVPTDENNVPNGKVTGMAATDKVAAQNGAASSLQAVADVLAAQIAGLSTNPAEVTATTRSFLNFTLNQVNAELKRIGG